MIIQQVMTFLQSIAPLRLAESWDNVGLLLGDPQQPAGRIMTCLTVTHAVVEEAIREKVTLIVSHHPVLFKPTQRITTQSTEGMLLWRLASRNIAVYSPHTAYDNAVDGINDQLARGLGLQQIQPLIPRAADPYCKLVVFVPETDLDQVSSALFQSGCGIIGNYSQCSFRLTGTGTFLGNTSANPSIGKAGTLEQVTEIRLEVVCPTSRIEQAILALKQAHSYEEPAVDIYPLQTGPAPASREGAGRCGLLAAPLPPADFAALVSSLLNTPVQLTGQRLRTPLSKVGIVCGAGGSLLTSAIQAGCDAFLTGELRFHDELSAQSADLTVVAAGHYATERPGVEYLAQRLALALPDCKVWASCAEQNPASSVTFGLKGTSV